MATSTALPRDFKAWLSRPSHIGPRKRKPLKKASRKRSMQLREYSKKRKAFLEAHPWCQVYLKRYGFHGQSIPRSTDIHHRAGRIGSKLLDEKDWVAASREGHEWVHNNPKEARKLGLLA